MAIKLQKIEDRKEGMRISKHDMDMRGELVYSSTVLIHRESVTVVAVSEFKIRSSHVYEKRCFPCSRLQPA